MRHEHIKGNGGGAYQQPDKSTKILVKGLKGKKSSYDAYLIPEGIEDYSYTKGGKEIKGFPYKVKLELIPQKEKIVGNIFICRGIQENLYALSKWELQNESRQHNKQ